MSTAWLLLRDGLAYALGRWPGVAARRKPSGLRQFDRESI